MPAPLLATLRFDLQSAMRRACLVSAFLSAGCNGSATDFAERIESSTPDRLRGLSIGYDISKLWAPDNPAPVPPKAVPRGSPHSRSQVPMTLWWQTPDGVIHHETLPAHLLYRDPERIAGAVWFRVTPAGATPPQPPPIAAPTTQSVNNMP
jgi:hypothetical protein